jgi:hypothetical protein
VNENISASASFDLVAFEGVLVVVAREVVDLVADLARVDLLVDRGKAPLEVLAFVRGAWRAPSGSLLLFA